MSNPLYSCMVSDQSSPPPRRRAARPVTPTSITATCLITQASSFPIGPQACGIFGYGQPKCIGLEPGGDRRGSPHPLPLCSARRRLTQDLLDLTSVPRAPRRSPANAGQCCPAQHSGLARRPNSGNMHCPGASARRCFNSADARSGAKSGSGTGLALDLPFRVRAQGRLARFHASRQ